MADQIRATPRSPILGLFSDLVNLPLQYMSSPERTQQSQGTAQFLYGTGIPKTLERLSYGESLFSGAGGLGGTTRMRPETAEAALTVAPFAPVAGRVAGRMVKATEGLPVGMGIKDVGKSAITREGNPIQGAVVLVGDKIFMGRTHGDALNRAVYEGVVRKEGGKYIYPKDAEVNSDLFMTKDGQIIDRLQASRMFDVGASETAIEKGLMQNNPPKSMTVESYIDQAKELKQQRAALPTQYPLAPAGTRYEEFGGDLTYMTPDEFLQQVRPLKLDAESLDNIAALRSHVESGGKLDPLHIYASGKEDGRHRAYLAKELGIEKVPVALHGQTPTPIESPAFTDPFANTIGSSIR